MSQSDEIDLPGNGNVLCPKCLYANEPSAAFCHECGAPIGMVATTDPIQHIHAEGFAYRSAIDGPPKLIILIGMWLVFLPVLALFPTMIFLLPGQSPLYVAFSSCLSVLSTVVLYRVTRNYIVKHRENRSVASP